jgi:glycosyltransferase 2 family protein
VSKKAWFWLRLIGSVVLVGYIAWKTDWSRIATAFNNLDSRFWFAALGLQLITQVISTWRWRMLAEPFKLGGTFREYLSYYFVGMFFNLVLPTSVGGDVVRAWYLAHRQKEATGKRMPAFLSVLADRVSGVVVLALVAAVATLLCPIQLPTTINIIVAGVALAALAGVIGLPLLNRILHSSRFASHRFERFRRISEGGMTYLRDRPLLAKTTALSLIVQVNSVLVMALIGVGLGLPIPLLYYGILMPLVTLLTLLPVSVNGMGLRELSTGYLLVPLSVDPAQAVTLAFLLFTAQSAASLLGLIPYFTGGVQRFDARAAAKENAEEEEESPSIAAA